MSATVVALAPAQIAVPASAGPALASSIATARIDLNVLARWISIVTSALRQIVTRTRGGLGPGDRADRATGNGADRSTDRPTGDQPPKQSTDDGATDRARGGIGWRRWRWRVRHWRRIADPRRGSIIGPCVVVHHLEVRDIGWRPFHRLRVEIQDAADIPVPSIAPVMHLMAPPSAFPCYAAVIDAAAKISFRKTADDALALRPRLPGARLRLRLELTSPRC